MQKFTDYIEEKLLPIASKVANIHWLEALKDTMISLMPFLIIGSVFLLIAYLPIPNWSDTIASFAGSGWESKITIVTDSTFGIMGFLVLIGMPYNYAKLKGADPIISIFLTVSSFFILTPINDGGITLQWFGSQGMFVNIILGIIGVNLYQFIHKKNIAPRMPEGVPSGVVKSFDALFPVLISSLLFLLIRHGVALTEYLTTHQLVFGLLQSPLMGLGNTLPAIIIAEGLGQILWFFGLHGNAIVSGVMSPIWISLADQNLQLVKAGLEPTNIITTQFKEVFLQIGGSGSTFPLVILMIISSAKQMKTLGWLALPASLFNINEPVIFGLPIVLNPLMFIPWVLNTFVYAIITYTTMAIGLVQKTSGITIPWTTPPIISGFLVSGVSGAVLQVVLILIGLVIYYPFFKAVEKSAS